METLKSKLNRIEHYIKKMDDRVEKGEMHESLLEK